MADGPGFTYRMFTPQAVEQIFNPKNDRDDIVDLVDKTQVYVGCTKDIEVRNGTRKKDANHGDDIYVYDMCSSYGSLRQFVFPSILDYLWEEAIDIWDGTLYNKYVPLSGNVKSIDARPLIKFRAEKPAQLELAKLYILQQNLNDIKNGNAMYVEWFLHPIGWLMHVREKKFTQYFEPPSAVVSRKLKLMDDDDRPFLWMTFVLATTPFEMSIQINETTISTGDSYQLPVIEIDPSTEFGKVVLSILDVLNDIQIFSKPNREMGARLKTDPDTIMLVIRTIFNGFQEKFYKKQPKNGTHFQQLTCLEKCGFLVKFSNDDKKIDKIRLVHTHLPAISKPFKRNDAEAFKYLIHRALRTNPASLPMVEKLLECYSKEMVTKKPVKFRVTMSPVLLGVKIMGNAKRSAAVIDDGSFKSTNSSAVIDNANKRPKGNEDASFKSGKSVSTVFSMYSASTAVPSSNTSKGLKNPFNLCYLNAAIQLLRMVAPINSFFYNTMTKIT